MKPKKPVDVINTEDAKKKSPNIQVVGDPDQWKLLCKASDKEFDWMKSTKARNVPGGVIIQTSTQIRGIPAESICTCYGVEAYKVEGQDYYDLRPISADEIKNLNFFQNILKKLLTIFDK